MDSISIVAPRLEAVEHEHIAAVALPMFGRASLVGATLLAEFDWRMCGQISAAVAQGAFKGEGHCLFPAAPWTSIDLLLIYGASGVRDEIHTGAFRALASLGRRDVAILPLGCEDADIDTLIKLSETAPHPLRVHLLATEGEASKIRLRAGRRDA